MSLTIGGLTTGQGDAEPASAPAGREPGNLWVVTVRQAPTLRHDPGNKVTAECFAADVCTDSTGEHHSFLAVGRSVAGVLSALPAGLHVTRVEQARWGVGL